MSSNEKMCDCNQGRLPCTCKPHPPRQMVSVPERMDAPDMSTGHPEAGRAFATAFYKERARADALAAILAQPADQPHGEPVALPERKLINAAVQDKTLAYCQGWNAYRDEMLKLGPLYTRPVQGDPIGMLYRIDGKVVIQVVGDPHIKDGMLVYTHADPGEVTLQQIMQAYEYAESHPNKYLRGTSNWCAAVAWHLNKQKSELGE